MIAFPLNWATGDKSQLVHEHAKRVKITLLDTQHNWELAVQVRTPKNKSVEITLVDSTIGNWPHR